ncbi:DUF58 domain-containing protein [Cryobacterium sp. 1639]|uniref:DUF58 domain-containing protein n=1 Tax=Cryobacterium inferilacus TaxID=2866629 RepID=UPI001C732A33|nr:DUF58 domain-containing protein [Cryobacterium sp. 1639]MBX0298695.1 DUF58 domain-containing protein [Cryobacterium sp. 1639]
MAQTTVSPAGEPQRERTATGSWSSPPPVARSRRLVRPTLRGGLFLGVGSALFIGAWGFDLRDLLFMAGVLVLVPVVALGYVLVHPVRVTVSRTFRPGSVPAGLASTVTLQIRNLADMPVSGLRWRDTAGGGIVVPDTQPLRPLGAARTGGPSAKDTAVVTYQVRPARRGSYAIGPLMLGRVDPFGLAYAEWPVGGPHDLTVTPRVTPLPGNGVSITRGEGARHERLRHLNNDSDELIAREYRPGDPMRRVNWPATARHGEIMVRQEEQRSHPEARIVLDTTRGGSPATSGYSPEFERAVELVASIAEHLLDGGFRVEMIEIGPSQLIPSPLGSSSLSPQRSGRGERRLIVDPDAGSHGGLRGDEPVAFTGPAGSRALLDALARVVRTDHAGPAGTPATAGGGSSGPARPSTRPGGGQIPTFAVLVDTNTADTTDVAALRPLCQPAVAFVFDTMPAPAVDRLVEAGWQCVPLTAVSPVDATWLRAGEHGGDHSDRY